MYFWTQIPRKTRRNQSKNWVVWFQELEKRICNQSFVNFSSNYIVEFSIGESGNLMFL